MRFFAIASVLSTIFLGVFASPVLERDTPKSIAAVLTDLTSTIAPLVDQLRYANSENATQATLTPIVNNMNAALNGAIGNMNLLSGQPNNVIMASVDGDDVLSALDIASLLSDVVTLIVNAVSAVLNVADPIVSDLIQSLVSPLLQLVCNLLSTVLSLVSGLLQVLQPLLEPVLSILSGLGLTNILGLLGLLGL